MLPQLLLLCAAHSAAAPPPPKMDVSLGQAGGVTVVMDGLFWLSGDEVSVCAGGRCYG